MWTPHRFCDDAPHSPGSGQPGGKKGRAQREAKDGIGNDPDSKERHNLEHLDATTSPANVQLGKPNEATTSATVGIEVSTSTLRKDYETDAASRPTVGSTKKRSGDNNMQTAHLTAPELEATNMGTKKTITEDEAIGRTLGVLEEMYDLMNDERSEGLDLSIHRLRPARSMVNELRQLKLEIAGTQLPANKNARKRVFAEMKRLSDLTNAPQQLLEQIIQDGFDPNETRFDELCDLLDGLNSKYPEIELITPPPGTPEEEEWLGGDPDDPFFDHDLRHTLGKIIQAG